MATLETLRKLKQEIEMDCLIYNKDNMPVSNPANDAVFICIEVIDEYIEQIKSEGNET